MFDSLTKHSSLEETFLWQVLNKWDTISVKNHTEMFLQSKKFAFGINAADYSLQSNPQRVNDVPRGFSNITSFC